MRANLLPQHSSRITEVTYLTQTFQRPQNTPIYDANGDLVQNANPNGYLIVPASYTVDGALAFATQVGTELGNTENDLGATVALDMMGAAFLPNGQQDLQRTYPESTGVHPGDFVSAFTDAASFNLGLISTYSGIGEDVALQGGGLLNEFHALFPANKHAGT
ncbi:hypothetical protein P3T24_007825 [Paraburkholderia sp. GAS33]|uniref:hypothetical protein n=1 Tax=Paraburkholderia sp. GAS33 TaxID=3035130 RepID=UPI003D1930C6